LALAVIPVIVIMSIMWSPSSLDLMVLGLAPAGALCRWFLGRKFNPNAKTLLCKNPCARTFKDWFPIGTWIANMAGVIVSAIVTSMTTTNTPAVFFNLFFAGSLSTVSTLIKEFASAHRHYDADKVARRPHQLEEKYAYGLSTFGLGIVLGVLFLEGGKYYW